MSAEINRSHVLPTPTDQINEAESTPPSGGSTPPRGTPPDDSYYFYADQAAQQLTGIHLAFHALLITALSVLASVTKTSPQKGIVIIGAFLGALGALVTIARDVRMESFRRFWSIGESSLNSGKWTHRYDHSTGDRLDQVSSWIEWDLLERAKNKSRLSFNRLSLWLAGETFAKYSRRYLAVLLLPLYLVVALFTIFGN